MGFPHGETHGENPGKEGFPHGEKRGEFGPPWGKPWGNPWGKPWGTFPWFPPWGKPYLRDFPPGENPGENPGDVSPKIYLGYSPWGKPGGSVLFSMDARKSIFFTFGPSESEKRPKKWLLFAPAASGQHHSGCTRCRGREEITPSQATPIRPTRLPFNTSIP